MTNRYRESLNVLYGALLVFLIGGVFLVSWSWADSGCQSPCPTTPTPAPPTPGHVVPDRPPDPTNTPRDIGINPFDGQDWKSGDPMKSKIGETVKIGGTEYVVDKDGNLIPKRQKTLAEIRQEKIEAYKKKKEEERQRQGKPWTLVRGDEVVKSGRTLGVVVGDVPVEKSEQWLCKYEDYDTPVYYQPKYLKVKDPTVKKDLQEMLSAVEKAEGATVKAGLTGFGADDMAEALVSGSNAIELQQRLNQYFSTDMNKSGAEADAYVTYEKVNGFPEIVIRNPDRREAYVISW